MSGSRSVGFPGSRPLLFTHPACPLHEPNPGHPESPDRLKVVLSALGDFILREAPLATMDDLLLVHTPEMIEKVWDLIPKDGIWALDEDTIISQKSGEAALGAVGAAVAAVNAVLDSEARFAFCAVRPPGHHATRTRPGGFCLFNNIAVAARHALVRRNVRRVAIIDFDAHHGNGTQDIFWHEPSVFFASTHKEAEYPYTGLESETGAFQNVVNVPLGPLTDGSVMRKSFERRILPALTAFKPNLLLISAGFDADAADPLVDLAWQAADYAWIGQVLRNVADQHCEGRAVAILEGGYDLTALAADVRAFCHAFL